MLRFARTSIAILGLTLPALGAAQVPTIEKVIQIGCAECDGPGQLTTILDVAVTDSGEIVIVDKSAPMLRVFDRTGRVLWTGGRSGRGPGEYVFPMRVAVGPDRGLSVVDMTARRMTRLARDGTVKGTDPILAFPVAASARGRSGEIIVLTDDFRGPFNVERWAPAAEKAVPHTTIARPVSPVGKAIIQPSITVAPSGILAFGTDPFTYRIGRLGADGKPLADIVRDIPPARRSEAEIQALESRLLQGPARQGAERSASKAPASGRSSIDLSMKPFFPLDGLRYDDPGRLWVLTTRGGEQQALFDLFAPAGAFLGSVTIPAQVASFALAGAYLVTGGEDADGIPRVTLWRVR